jgi:hypothetical protein
MRVRTLVAALALLPLAAAPGQAQKQFGAPEAFTANIKATGARGGAAAATIEIDIRRYTPEADRTAVEQALKTGGYPAFLTALRKAPEVGAVMFGEQKWPIRWARERPSGQYNREIVVVTDQPIFFVGGGSAKAKPKEGYEVALIQIDVDNVGLGKGTMTAAARVKPGGEAGVRIDDYAEKPIQLVTVSRKLK